MISPSAPLRLSGRIFPGFRIADLTTRLIALETAIYQHVYHLFALTPTDRALLTAHSHHAMIDYPYGAV